MIIEDFINEQIAMGCDIHFNNGVWWQKVGPYFCKPVYPLQIIDFGIAKPKTHKALLGYSYLVCDKRFANRFWSVMLLNNERLKNFEMQSLSSSKRARVRKGLKLTEIRRIGKIEPYIDDIKDICVSAAIRTRHGKPPEYYTKYYKKWRSWILSLFNLSTREWWGAFHNGSLIAYAYAHNIEGKMFLSAFKSHTDSLDKCPNDALLFSFLTYCKELPDCNEVIFGDWSDDAPSLNSFKEKFRFNKVDLPVYAKYSIIFHLAKAISNIIMDTRKLKSGL